MTKMKRSKLIICCGLVLIGGLIIGWTLLPGPGFGRSYRQLQIGMPQSEVQAVFGQEPDYHCRFDRSEIWYFAAPGMFTPEFPAGTPEPGATYGSLRELPDVYDHVQVAFDENGKSVAYTWIGETYTVEYRGGSVTGTYLKLLPPGVL